MFGPFLTPHKKKEQNGFSLEVLFRGNNSTGLGKPRSLGFLTEFFSLNSRMVVERVAAREFCQRVGQVPHNASSVYQVLQG